MGQALALIFLFSWVAAWWLAVRVVFGRAFYLFEWIPVAFCAFGVPFLVASVCVPSASANQFPSGLIVSAWGCVALTIDTMWVVRAAFRRSAARRAERARITNTSAPSA